MVQPSMIGDQCYKNDGRTNFVYDDTKFLPKMTYFSGNSFILYGRLQAPFLLRLMCE